VLQHAGRSAAESDSASVGTLVRSRPERAKIAKNFLIIFRCSAAASPQIIVLGLIKNTRDPCTNTMAKTTMCTPCNLTREVYRPKMHYMAHSFLIFDFGGNEDVAQQARHKVDAWKQGFRLGKKLELKFDRKEPATASGSAPEAPKEGSKPKGKSKEKAKTAHASGAKAEPQTQIRLLVRLDFSDHEKLSHQRWLDRIPLEEPFKNMKSQIVCAGDPEFKATSDLFESLN
jgi:hypothetical protein